MKSDTDTSSGRRRQAVAREMDSRSQWIVDVAVMGVKTEELKPVCRRHYQALHGLLESAPRASPAECSAVQTSENINVVKLKTLYKAVTCKCCRKQQKVQKHNDGLLHSLNDRVTVTSGKEGRVHYHYVAIRLRCVAEMCEQNTYHLAPHTLWRAYAALRDMIN